MNARIKNTTIITLFALALTLALVAAVLSTATTKNCTRLSRTPSSRGAKWSTAMIWKVNSAAHSSRMPSLASMLPKPPCMHSR